MVWDAMLLDEPHEIRGGVAGERGFGEVRIRRKEIIGGCMQIGEITATAAGDQNLFADSICTFQNQHVPPALASFNGAHQASRAASKNDDVVFLIHLSSSPRSELSRPLGPSPDRTGGASFWRLRT